MMSGYSRFPVHEPGKPESFIGLLLVKKLLKYDPASEQPVSKFQLGILPEALPSINCFQALDYFQTGRAHLLLITSSPGVAGGALGVITLEDIIEEIISEEIVDETDRYEDNQSKRRAKRATNAAVMRGIVERRIGVHRRPSAVRTIDSTYGSRSASAAPTEEARSLLARDFAGNNATIVEGEGPKSYGTTENTPRS
jgi:metal transporter CNNM